MFNLFSFPILIILFVVSGVVTWLAGIYVSETTDRISSRFHIGEALGGLIILGFITNLPELAIVVSASIAHHLDIATGDILGGIAMQTLVLVVEDVFGIGRKGPLTYYAASLVLALEGVLVNVVLVVAIMATQLPSSLIFARIAPGAFMIAALWVIGVVLIDKARHSLPWQENGNGPGSQPGLSKSSKMARATHIKNMSFTMIVIVFIIASLFTLAAGVALEETSNLIAKDMGWNGVVFAATVLALTTSLPDLSTGIASIKVNDYKMAVSDILGGNAFLPVLFFLANLISGQAVLPRANSTDIYLSGLGILLVSVYIYGLIFRPRIFKIMGIDSLTVLILYIIGIGGLFFVARGGG
jgi:cation:H+ antiporter